MALDEAASELLTRCLILERRGIGLGLFPVARLIPLTPALSRGERENPPRCAISRRSAIPSDGRRGTLSSGERAGVRGNWTHVISTSSGVLSLGGAPPPSAQLDTTAGARTFLSAAIRLNRTAGKLETLWRAGVAGDRNVRAPPIRGWGCGLGDKRGPPGRARNQSGSPGTTLIRPAHAEFMTLSRPDTFSFSFSFSPFGGPPDFVFIRLCPNSAKDKVKPGDWLEKRPFSS